MNTSQNDNSKTVLILGAAGRVGQALVRAFATAGWQVIAQARKPLPDALQRMSGVRRLQRDARELDAVVAESAGAGVVVNALNPLYTEWQELALPLADAAQQIAERLGALLMLPGNVYNFGREVPAVLRPDTSEVASTSKAAIRIEAEARMARAAERGLDSVVLRAGDFFGGPGRGSWFDMAVVASLKNQGRVVYPGPRDRIHSWAYLPDLAATFVKVAQQQDRLHGHHRLHFAGHWVEGQVLHEAIEAVAGRKLKTGGMPWWLMRLASPFKADWRAYVEMSYLWQRPHRLDDTSLRALIGTVPHTPLEQALRESLSELGLLDAQTDSRTVQILTS